MQRQAGYILLMVVLGLIALGLVMLFSTSANLALKQSPETSIFLRRQAVWLAVGVVACIIFARVDYHFLVRYSPWAMGFATLLLAGCFVPHIGHMVNGANRWIQVGPVGFQPSEFTKLVLIFFLAGWLARHQRQLDSLKGFIIPGGIAMVVALLIAKEPDLGSAAQIIAIFIIMMYCAGAAKRYLFLVPILAVVGIGFYAASSPYHLEKLKAFVSPSTSTAVAQGKGWQQYQALIAIGSGGLDGQGPGNSRQKMNFVPEAHTDFIFAIIAEELGMYVSLGVVLAYVMLTLSAGWISLRAPDPMGLYLGIGITCMLALQAWVNLAVVTSLVPNKGLPLPFVSYGGSNLLLCLASVGVLFNLQRQGTDEEETDATALIANRSSVRM